MNFLIIALGGALGACRRYALSLIPIKMDFPLMTLITNFLGALLIGFVVGLAARNKAFSTNKLLFWKTGVCGAFTTFSTFSLESLRLIEKQNGFLAAIYIVASISLCLFGVFLGEKISSFAY